MLTSENCFRTAEGSKNRTTELGQFIPPQYLDFSFYQNQFIVVPHNWLIADVATDTRMKFLVRVRKGLYQTEMSH